MFIFQYLVQGLLAFVYPEDYLVQLIFVTAAMLLNKCFNVLVGLKLCKIEKQPNWKAYLPFGYVWLLGYNLGDVELFGSKIKNPKKIMFGLFCVGCALFILFGFNGLVLFVFLILKFFVCRIFLLDNGCESLMDAAKCALIPSYMLYTIKCLDGTFSEGDILGKFYLLVDKYVPSQLSFGGESDKSEE